jgi:hypothetical protein
LMVAGLAVGGAVTGAMLSARSATSEASP